MMRALVCGGRNYTDKEHLFTFLDRFHSSTPITTLIHGAAQGADSMAAQWGYANLIEVVSFPARWLEHGRGAGILRNQQMLEEGKPDVIIAFPDKSYLASLGTRDMVNRARRNLIPVIIADTRHADWA